jgi:hypothetical protein
LQAAEEVTLDLDLLGLVVRQDAEGEVVFAGGADLVTRARSLGRPRAS